MRRVVLAALALSAAAVASVHAHLCLIEPRQRSTFGVGKPGNDACYRKVGPCGFNTFDPNGPVTTLTAGAPYAVAFQQNLNHFYTQKPGLLDVSIAYNSNPKESDFTPLGSPVADYNAMNMITQTNFTVAIAVPDTPCDACVLRARYVSNNPLENDRGETFYQCADIKIKPKPKPQSIDADAVAVADADADADADAAAAVPSKPPVNARRDALQYHFPVLPHGKRVVGAVAPTTPCCAARSFSMAGYETGSWRAPTQIQVFVDGDAQLMRVDTESGAGTGTTIYDGSFVMYLNFTSGIEYYLNTVTNECGVYGLDYWNDWCFGGYNQTETFTQQLLIGDMTVNEWSNGNFLFGSSADTCTPVFQSRVDTGAFTLWTDFDVGAPTPSVFQPPAICHLALQRVQSQLTSKSRPLPPRATPDAQRAHATYGRHVRGRR